MQPAIPDLHVEFNRYRSTAVIPEPGFIDDGRPDIDPRESRALPGTRAPHVELVRDGRTISAIDLYTGDFVLMAGPAGAAWCDAASTAGADVGVAIECYRIGDDLLDNGDFCEHCGIGADGAVLVRPDGYVAWRRQALPDEDCVPVLKDVMKTVLSLN
jgi:putative polyketide hydroxylase